MECPKCGFENPQGAKYCQKCANIFYSASSQSTQGPVTPSDYQPKIKVVPTIELEGIIYKKGVMKKITLIIVLVLLIGSLSFAGYYY